VVKLSPYVAVNWKSMKFQIAYPSIALVSSPSGSAKCNFSRRLPGVRRWRLRLVTQSNLTAGLETSIALKIQPSFEV